MQEFLWKILGYPAWPHCGGSPGRANGAAQRAAVVGRQDISWDVHWAARSPLGQPTAEAWNYPEQVCGNQAFFVAIVTAEIRHLPVGGKDCQFEGAGGQMVWASGPSERRVG